MNKHDYNCVFIFNELKIQQNQMSHIVKIIYAHSCQIVSQPEENIKTVDYVQDLGSQEYNCNIKQYYFIGF